MATESELDDYSYALQLQLQFDRENAAATTNDENRNINNVDQDRELAIKLHKELNSEQQQEEQEEFLSPPTPPSKQPQQPKQKHHKLKSLEQQQHIDWNSNMSNSFLNSTNNIVHPEWELIDPTPDIHTMFYRFDEKFFQKRLGAVMIEWSRRMYSCAGICYQRGGSITKSIIIRLSEPLLKLRPRKNLVETMLHEMIHAFCFVHNIHEGNGGHGPVFKKMMETINKVAGTNITVYHSFVDEVELYKTHVWRCNGICQNRSPFHGWVKRTSNRPPGPNDQWWHKHQMDCSGTFEKMSEPSKPPKPPKNQQPKKSTKSVVKSQSDDLNPTADIRKFLTNSDNSNNIKGAIGRKPATPIAKAFPRFGHLLPLPRGTNSIEQSAPIPNLIRLRELRTKRFATTEMTMSSSGDNKRPRLLKPKEEKTDEDADDDKPQWKSIDNDMMILDQPVVTITLSDDDDDDGDGDTDVTNGTNDVVDDGDDDDQSDEESQLPSHKPRTFTNSTERKNSILRELMEDEDEGEDNVITLIDDEYDDAIDEQSFSAAGELADQSVIDDIFGEDTLLEEFTRHNDVYPRSSNRLENAGDDITSCPICFEKMKRSLFSNHLEGCSYTIPILPIWAKKPKAKQPAKPPAKQPEKKTRLSRTPKK